MLCYRDCVRGSSSSPTPVYRSTPCGRTCSSGRQHSIWTSRNRYSSCTRLTLRRTTSAINGTVSKAPPPTKYVQYRGHQCKSIVNSNFLWGKFYELCLYFWIESAVKSKKKLVVNFVGWKYQGLWIVNHLMLRAKNFNHCMTWYASLDLSCQMFRKIYRN